MSSLEERREIATAGMEDVEPPTAARVVLQPLAPPSVLGLFGFSGATLIVAAHMAGWYGGATTPDYVFPFAAVFGGVAQFAAGMWSYRARDALATAMHGMWGSFWMAYGILFALFATGALVEPKGAFPALGFWFVPLAAITWSGALAALAERSFGVSAVLGVLAAGATVAAPALWTGSTGWTKVAGWVFVVAAGAAWYMATAMLLAACAGRPLLPLLKTERRDRPHRGLELAWPEPGVRRGQ